MIAVETFVTRKAAIAKGMWTLGYEPLRVVKVPAECHGECVIVEGDDRHWRTTNFHIVSLPAPPALGDETEPAP